MPERRYSLRESLLVLCVAVGGCANLQPQPPARDASADGADAAPPVGAPTQHRNLAIRGPAPDHPGAVAAAGGPRWAPVRAAAASDDEPVGLWARVRSRFRLPAAAHERIASEVRRYDGRQQYFDRVLRRAEPYVRHIEQRLEARDLPAELLLVPIVESGFRPFAYSYSSAGGLWQFKPATGKHFGLEMNWWYDGRRDVLASTEAALDYFEYLHDFFDGDWLLAIAAYNAGEGRVQQAVRHNAARGRPTDFWHLDLPRQTEKYVPRILALRAVLADPWAHGIELPELSPDSGLTVVEVDHQIDLALAARLAGVSIDTVYRFNPGFNRWATPPDGPYRLAFPGPIAERFRERLAEQDPDDMVQWHRHRVRSGETLSGIAGRYHTTVAALRDVNDIGGSLIRAGDHLLVPTSSKPGSAYTLSAENRRRATQSRGPSGRTRVEYEVRRGDTFWEVARAHDVKVRRLAAWNDMAPGDPLHPGQQLVIWVDGGGRQAAPSARMQRVRYVVRRGDSLYAIARQFNVRVADIRRWNALDADAVLQPGQTLKLHVDVTQQAEAG